MVLIPLILALGWTTPVKGKSMEPLIHRGDIITVVPALYEDIQPEWIVLIKGPNFNICHMAEFKVGTKWATRGINNFRRDPALMGPEDFLGRIILIRPPNSQSDKR